MDFLTAYTSTLKGKRRYASILFLFFLAPLCSHSDGPENAGIPALHSVKASDHFQFGRLWPQIRRLEKNGLLYTMISERREEIETIKNHWQAKLSPLSFEGFNSLFQEGTLIRSEKGCGSAYFLLDKENKPQFVIKPFDEDILCLNNPKHFASPYNDKAIRVRDDIPLYRSAQAEALASAIAKTLGISNQTPATELAILSHDQFFDITEHLSTEASLLYQTGKPDREKLCSVHPYLSDIKNLYELVEEWLEQNLAEETILTLIDQEDFEKLFLLIWLLYDTDAHAGNLYAQKDHNGVYHLLKLDNGLAFPDKNSHLLNALYFFPHSHRSLSKQSHLLIQNLPLDECISHFLFFEMEDALDAFLQRVAVLQELLAKNTYSLREIDTRLRSLELPDGKQIALSKMSLEQLENLISYE